MRIRNAILAAIAGGALWTAPAAAESPAMEITIDGSRIFPENIDADDAGNVYATSLDGTIYRATPGSDTAEPWIMPDDENKLLWTLGVYSHDASNTLWVCSTPIAFVQPPRTGDAAVVAFDLKTGAFKARYVMPPAPAGGQQGAVCNDIAVGQYGKVYVTDTGGGRLFSIAPNAKEMTLESADPQLNGVEGPAFSADNQLYLNNTRNNGIFRVNRDGQGNFQSLTKLTTSIPLDSADGFRHYKGNQFLQAETGGSGRITLVTITGDNAEVKVLKEGTGSAGVTFFGDTIYSAEGKIGYLFDPALREKSPDTFVIKGFKLGDGE